MKWNRRRDANEAPIVAAFRKSGAFVERLDGSGCPDLVVQFNGHVVLVEVKEPSDKAQRESIKRGKLTPAQIAWWSGWGPVKPTVVTTVAEALELIQKLSTGSQQPLLNSTPSGAS